MTDLELQALNVPAPSVPLFDLYKDGDTKDIISAINYADKEFRKRDLVGNLPEILRGATDYETLENVWYFVKGNMQYKTDKAGHEVIKLPNWMLYNKIGDCKSYSILIAAILQKLGFKYVYRYVGFDDDRDNPTHVYVVAYLKKGDAVILDAVHTAFDNEPPHIFSTDRKPSKGIGLIRV
jgi:predicted transglutaminase-like cysteine proteinase